MIDFTFGLFGMVVEPPSVDGSDPLMVISPFLEVEITSEYFWRRQQPNSLWSALGMNLLSLLHCVA